MSEVAWIKLVPESSLTEISLEDLKGLLSYYYDITTKTGDQLGWTYGDHAFPYTVKEQKQTDDTYLLLQAMEGDILYNAIYMDITEENTVIRITLTEHATHGDKGKANELLRFMAKKWAGELHLFNGRIMYYYNRK